MGKLIEQQASFFDVIIGRGYALLVGPKSLNRGNLSGSAMSYGQRLSM